jgi:uncharacterized protein YaaN involved in tellurite resistance
MTQTTQSVSPLRQRMIDDMMMRKLAASMGSCRKVSRDNKELAAKANIATTVSNKVFVVIP